MGEVSKKFTTQLYEAVYQVEEDQDGMRLDQYCATFFVTFSRQQIKKKIAAGEVQILNRPYPHKASVKVYEYEKVRITTPRGDLEDEYWRGEKMDLEFTPEILFEDKDIIAISKPSYMTTHPTGKHLFNCATVFFEQRDEKTIHSIHRLDRETSGVLLLAKNPKAAQICTDHFEKNKVNKCYFFMAHKRDMSKTSFPFVANERLGNIEEFVPRLYVHCFDFNSLEGKHAQTTFHSIWEDDEYILGLAFPKTGRQHQIRAHAAFHGFPLIGDKLYNGDPKIFQRFKDAVATKEDHDLMDLSRHALHATAIQFPYPKEENLLINAPIPNDFKAWIKLRLASVDIEDLEANIKSVIVDTFKN